MDWIELETSTYQDHVIKHVLGATVLGWAITAGAAHLLLDIGLLWTVYSDAEMNLLPQGVALAELEPDELTAADRAELAADADLLIQQGREVAGLRRFTAAPVECMIQSVELFGLDNQRMLLLKGDEDDLKIECATSGEINIGLRDT